MTEIPEHLLQRSRERRSALGLGGDDSGAAPQAANTPAVARPAAAAAPRPAAPTPSAPPAPKPVPAYVRAANERRRIPMWATPVLALLPLWGFMYMRATTENPPTLTGPMAEGAVVYNKCASCHGVGGEGGAAYPLNAGSVLRTFPSIEEQITFVYHGSDEIKGEPYGDPARGRIAGTKGKMPAWGTNFGGELTDAEIVATVCHERFKLATADVPTALADEYEHWCTPDGEKWLEVEEGGLAKAGVTTAVG